MIQSIQLILEEKSNIEFNNQSALCPDTHFMWLDKVLVSMSRATLDRLFKVLRTYYIRMNWAEPKN